MGDVSGIMDNQKAIDPSGLATTDCASTKDRIKGMVIGNINCWVSASLSTADPMAAKRAPYKRYPPMK